MSYLLHEPVIGACEKFKEKKALDEEGRIISYRDLNKLSNKWACFLSSLLSKRPFDRYIGIISPVYTESIISVLGVLRAGLTYVPLDYKSPAERIRKIIQDASIKTLIVDEVFFNENKPLFNNLIKEVIVLGNKNLSSSQDLKVYSLKQVLGSKTCALEFNGVVSDDLAYILYTSGSTGIPKGVMLSHQNARTFVDWMIKEFKINSKDRVLSRAPFQFDLSVFDIFATLSTGATLIVKNPHKNTNDKHKEFVSLIRDKKVTVIYTTPSTYISFVNKGGFDKNIPSIRLILYAGEPFPIPFLRKLISILPNSKFANIYGPTETNIVSYYWINEIKPSANSIPIGKPVDDTDIKIVNENFKLCKTGELGEIWVRGGTVTKGYLGNKEKTDECLVQSPFHAYPAKYWRTGDYGLLMADGNIEYHGRKDNMIKTRSFRVELGEVESAVSSFKGIKEFSVVPFPHNLYQNTLCVFLSVKEKFNLEEFKKHLKSLLPYYMIPYEYVLLDYLPKTSSGKVDREFLKKANLEKKRLEPK